MRSTNTPFLFGNKQKKAKTPTHYRTHNAPQCTLRTPLPLAQRRRRGQLCTLWLHVIDSQAGFAIGEDEPLSESPSRSSLHPQRRPRPSPFAHPMTCVSPALTPPTPPDGKQKKKTNKQNKQLIQAKEAASR